MYIFILLFIYIFVTSIEIRIFKKSEKYDNAILFILALLYNFTLAFSFTYISLLLLIIGVHGLGALFGEWIFPLVILLYIGLWGILLFPMNKLMKNKIDKNLLVYIIFSFFSMIFGCIFFFLPGPTIMAIIYCIIGIKLIALERKTIL